MESKLIMVIAGSQWQIPIVRKIKEMGHRALVVNLYEDSPAFAYADFHEVCDILDKAKCLEIAKKYNIDAVLSEECDIATPTVAYIAKELGISGLSEESAHLYTDKSAMREFSETHNLPSPKYRKCSNIEEVKQFIKENQEESSTGRKIIIKPLDSNSSRGVHIINRAEELPSKFEDALSYSHIEKQVLAEQYIEGTEFTVDGIMTPQGHVSLAISEKKHYDFNPSIANELFFSQENDKFDYDLLRATNDRFVNLSNLEIGTLTHAEYKYMDGKFWLIEIGARGGGNLISAEIVPLMSGIDNYEYLIRSSLGDFSWSLPEMSPKAECSVLRFLDTDFEQGTVKEIQGEELLRDKDVITYKLNFKTGDTISKAANDSARIGFYIAKSSGKETLREFISHINQNFRVIPE